MAAIDYGRVEVLTFDCYGTLIDWEAGIARGTRGRVTRAHGVDVPDEELLDDAMPATRRRSRPGPYLRYREVLAARLPRRLRRPRDRRRPTPRSRRSAGRSATWPAFPDSAAALARARTGGSGSAVITNCDDDLFAASNRRLGVDVRLGRHGPAGRGYKPSHRNFELAFERIGGPRERILHVAQSLFHDHVPAKELGLHVGLDQPPGRPRRARGAPRRPRPRRTRRSRTWPRSRSRRSGA